MLAQNFKTAAELQISDQDLDALIKCLSLLERGDVTHKSGTMRFNMNRYWNQDLDERNEFCSVGCIAGWADFLVGRSGRDPSSFQYRAGAMSGIAMLVPALQDLFAGAALAYRLHKITVEQAAHALRGYLTTGEVNWGDALTASARSSRQLRRLLPCLHRTL